MTRLKRDKDLPSTHKNDVRFGTPELAAAYRAERIATLAPDTIIEVGAGAGFQTGELAKIAKHVIAIDVDAQRLSRATMPPNVIVIAGDALDPKVLEEVRRAAKGTTAVFLDPERPASAKQRTLSEIRPDIVRFVEEYGKITPDIAIELPPFLLDLPSSCEREYLSIDGKLNRLTAYFGRLRRCDLSVVRLPEEERVEHNGPLPALQSQDVRAAFILEPDAALAHAGLSHTLLGTPYHAESLGKRTIFLTTEPASSPFFSTYKILAVGERNVERLLPAADCATVILHGALAQEEQKNLLRRLNKLCRGKKRLHLFLGKEWRLARRVSTRES